MLWEHGFCLATKKTTKDNQYWIKTFPTQSKRNGLIH